MDTKFRRQEYVILKRAPLSEDTEPWIEEIAVKAGMKGKINVILPNGRYHVEIYDENGKVVAYAAMDEDDLERIPKE